jgi:hypothetical protein
VQRVSRQYKSRRTPPVVEKGSVLLSLTSKNKMSSSHKSHGVSTIDGLNRRRPGQNQRPMPSTQICRIRTPHLRRHRENSPVSDEDSSCDTDRASSTGDSLTISYHAGEESSRGLEHGRKQEIELSKALLELEEEAIRTDDLKAIKYVERQRQRAQVRLALEMAVDQFLSTSGLTGHGKFEMWHRPEEWRAK